MTGYGSYVDAAAVHAAVGIPALHDGIMGHLFPFGVQEIDNFMLDSGG